MFAELPEFKDVYCLENERVQDNLCVACPDGSVNKARDFAGGDEDTSCDPIFCEVNQRVDGHVCRPCDLGTQALAGADASKQNTFCQPVLCDVDQKVESNACVSCPAGAYAPKGANASGANTSCTPKACGKNQRVEANACVDCLQGSTNAAGDLTDGTDTICDGMKCAESQYVSSNVCLKCPIGTTNQGGDDASGEDTTCESERCLANQFVLANVCTPCAAGTSRPAGDEATGADTSCSSVLCEVNQRVQDNQCIPCSGTSLNEPGDDAAGENTACIPFSYKYVSTGPSHTCAVTVVGGVQCWGDNAQGKLGLGDEVDRAAPTDVTGLEYGVVQVKASTRNTCAVTKEGELYCWGINNYRGPNVTMPIPEKLLKPFHFPVLLGEVTQVELSESDACVKIKGRGFYCWGNNYQGLLGDPSIGRTQYLIKLSLGESRNEVGGLSMGKFAACATSAEQPMTLPPVDASCWGSNQFNMLGDGKIMGKSGPAWINPRKAIFDIDVGRNHVCATTGTVNTWFTMIFGNTLCWGNNVYGGLDPGFLTVPQEPAPIKSKEGGTVNYEDVECGGDFTCGRYGGSSKNIIQCWGRNNAGQLGDGTTNDSVYPVNVSSLSNDDVQWFDVGEDHACALTGAGKIKCWGSNASGKLGDGTTENRSTPVEVKTN